MIAAEHAEERGSKQELAAELEHARASLAKERTAHRHAVQRCAELLRARDEAKEALRLEQDARAHAHHLQSTAESRAAALKVRPACPPAAPAACCCCGGCMLPKHASITECVQRRLHGHQTAKMAI